MKRIASLAIVIILLFSAAFAEDGVFVPSYDSFMESFCDLAANDHSELSAFIKEHYLTDNGWDEICSSLEDCFVCVDESLKLEISTNEHWGQLEFFSMRTPCGSSSDSIQVFDSIARYIAQAINPNEDWSKADRMVFRYLDDSLFDDSIDTEHYSWRGIHRYSFIRRDGYAYFIVEVMTDEGEGKVHRTPFGYEAQ